MVHAPSSNNSNMNVCRFMHTSSCRPCMHASCCRCVRAYGMRTVKKNARAI
jgi:hypothetical protein